MFRPLIYLVPFFFFFSLTGHGIHIDPSIPVRRASLFENRGNHCFVPLRCKKNHNFSKLVSSASVMAPYLHEELLADLYSLQLVEVMGVLRSFFDEPLWIERIFNGEISILKSTTSKKKGEQKLILANHVNLLQAYKEGLLRFKNKKNITVDDLEFLWSISYLVTADSRTRRIIEDRGSKVVINKANSIITLRDHFHPEAIERMRSYNINVDFFPECVSEFTANIRTSKSRPFCSVIHYPNETIYRESVNKYLLHLSQLLQEGADKKEIILFAYRDFLILHPFKDGNGRVAQLLAQIFTKLLTGKNIILPKEFHKELNSSHDELKKILIDLIENAR